MKAAEQGTPDVETEPEETEPEAAPEPEPEAAPEDPSDRTDLYADDAADYAYP